MSEVRKYLQHATEWSILYFRVIDKLHKGDLFDTWPNGCLPWSLPVGENVLCACVHEEHKDWSICQWSQVLYTDISRFDRTSDFMSECHYYGCDYKE